MSVLTHCCFDGSSILPNSPLSLLRAKAAPRTGYAAMWGRTLWVKLKRPSLMGISSSRIKGTGLAPQPVALRQILWNFILRAWRGSDYLECRWWLHTAGTFGPTNIPLQKEGRTRKVGKMPFTRMCSCTPTCP